MKNIGSWIRSVPLAALALAFVPVPAEAVLMDGDGTEWKKTWAIGAVTGEVGNLIEPSNPDVGIVEGFYGHLGDGETCQGFDGKLQENYQLVILTHQTGDPTSIGVLGTVSMTDQKAFQDTTDGHCEVGPPSFNATSVVTASMPAPGTQGSSQEACRVSDIWAHASPHTEWVHDATTQPSNPQFQPQSQAQGGIWTIDPNNPSTKFFRVSTKIDCMFTGSGVEIIVGNTNLEARITLTVTID